MADPNPRQKSATQKRLDALEKKLRDEGIDPDELLAGTKAKEKQKEKSAEEGSFLGDVKKGFMDEARRVFGSKSKKD